MSDKWVDPDADRDFRTVIPPALLEEYYSALGRLMHAFARAEDNLNLTVANIVGKHVFPESQYEVRIPDSWSRTSMLAAQKAASLSIQRSVVLKAVLGGQRLAPLRDTLKRVLKVIDADERMTAETNRILAHLGEIQFMRDKFAHNAAHADMTNKDGWFYTSNKQTVRADDDWEIIYFKPSMLVDMAFDLERIPDLLHKALELESHARLMLDPEYAALMEHPETREWLGPWRYKPSALRREGQKHGPNRRKSTHSQKSSRG